jgi:hypothetical protein
VVPADIHDFFMASAGAAGALIGLLFVAISVAGDRLAKRGAGAQVHRIRANAALIAFNNALSVSLFALIPGEIIGWTAVAAGSAGLLFVAGSLVSLARAAGKHWPASRKALRDSVFPIGRDALFLIGMAVAFVVQLTAGLNVADNPADAGSVRTIAILVIVFFLFGISRAWELVGGPSIDLRRQVVDMVRSHEQAHGAEAAEQAEGPDQAEAADRGESARGAEGPGTPRA